MQAVALIFRRTCPDPEDRPANLPSLLSNINIPLQYYATLDVILSAAINRPMNFRYDTTFATGVYRSLFDLENGPAVRWAYDIPDKLVITLALMNGLLEDFGSAVHPKLLEELEIELRDMRTITVTSANPSLGAGRPLRRPSYRTKLLKQGLCGLILTTHES
ncbi:hypothetical protein OPQ81_010392 [Rhizoctonia solani]|nr:hypothetical protein OPQ81_010392 [Rhizoctonia solani]